MALDELNDSDEQVEANGVQLIFHHRDKDFLDDLVIDYNKSPWGEGFMVQQANPGLGC